MELPLDHSRPDRTSDRLPGDGLPPAAQTDNLHHPLFRGVAAIRKQLATAPGLIGYTLRAKPLARDYWTAQPSAHRPLAVPAQPLR